MRMPSREKSLSPTLNWLRSKSLESEEIRPKKSEKRSDLARKLGG